jgi:5-dehydro-2-deoxygluconokinase
MCGVTVILDIDFRPDQWLDPLYFGVTIRSALHAVDLVIGTEDEINAVMLSNPEQVKLTDSQVSDARVQGNTQENIRKLLSMGPGIVIEKVGSEGCRIHNTGGTVMDAPGYPVEITNILGAGDAFGAGFIYGYVKNWDLLKAARFANACGAIVVTRPGCSNSMPKFDEVMDFIDGRGGL